MYVASGVITGIAIYFGLVISIWIAQYIVSQNAAITFVLIFTSLFGWNSLQASIPLVGLGKLIGGRFYNLNVWEVELPGANVPIPVSP